MNRFYLITSGLLILLVVLLVLLMICGLFGCNIAGGFIGGLINSTCIFIGLSVLAYSVSGLTRRFKLPIPQSLSTIGICTAVIMLIWGVLAGFHLPGFLKGWDSLKESIIDRNGD